MRPFTKWEFSSVTAMQFICCEEALACRREQFSVACRQLRAVDVQSCRYAGGRSGGHSSGAVGHVLLGLSHRLVAEDRVNVIHHRRRQLRHELHATLPRGASSTLHRNEKCGLTSPCSATYVRWQRGTARIRLPQTAAVAIDISCQPGPQQQAYVWKKMIIIGLIQLTLHVHSSGLYSYCLSWRPLVWTSQDLLGSSCCKM